MRLSPILPLAKNAQLPESAATRERQESGYFASALRRSDLDPHDASRWKDALRRQAVDREAAKAAIRFLAQPMGRSLHQKLKQTHDAWADSHDDATLLMRVSGLADEFGKTRPAPSHAPPAIQRHDLKLICFEYVTG